MTEIISSQIFPKLSWYSWELSRMMVQIILISIDNVPLAVAEATRKAAFLDSTMSL
jgi:hypothetical protein